MTHHDMIQMLVGTANRERSIGPLCCSLYIVRHRARMRSCQVSSFVYYTVFATFAAVYACNNPSIFVYAPRGTPSRLDNAPRRAPASRTLSAASGGGSARGPRAVCHPTSIRCIPSNRPFFARTHTDIITLRVQPQL